MGNSDALIAEHIEYVKALARKIHTEIRSTIECDELEAYGMQGLVEAAGRFDPAKGAKFKTFAYYRIRGAIYDGLRKIGWLDRTEYARYQVASNAYLENMSSRGLDDASSDVDAAGRIQEAIEDLSVIFVTSLEGYTEKTGLEISDGDDGVESRVISKDQRSKLSEILKKLPPDEANLIHQHYFEGISFKDVAIRLKISKSWCSRLHTKAIRNLGTLYREMYGDSM